MCKYLSYLQFKICFKNDSYLAIILSEVPALLACMW